MTRHVHNIDQIIQMVFPVNLSVWDYSHYLWQLLNGFRANGEKRIAEERNADVGPYLRTAKPLRVLDLANGSLRPQYILMQTTGYLTYGVDLVNRPRRNLFSLAYAIARSIYRWKLGLPVKDYAGRLVCGDVTRLPFSRASFDLVTSVAAFEHFLNVPAVLSEVARVLKPGGLIYARIHLFTCLSGGHNVRLTQMPLSTLPQGVDPWDHLRKRRLRFHVSLNEWRKDQYVSAFKQHFDILKHYCATHEGEHLLTPQVERELSEYHRDELTCSAYVIVARKRQLKQ